jgi:hypothetical protein
MSRRRIKIAVGVALVGIVVATGVALLSFAARSYQRREFDEHRRYLQSLLARELTIAQVEAELGQEPIKVVEPSDAKAVAKMWTDPRNSPAEVEAKVSKWPQTRIYRKSPMLYFIYFDSEGLMRDFSCLTS